MFLVANPTRAQPCPPRAPAGCPAGNGPAPRQLPGPRAAGRMEMELTATATAALGFGHVNACRAGGIGHGRPSHVSCARHGSYIGPSELVSSATAGHTTRQAPAHTLILAYAASAANAASGSPPAHGSLQLRPRRGGRRRGRCCWVVRFLRRARRRALHLQPGGADAGAPPRRAQRGRVRNVVVC